MPRPLSRKKSALRAKVPAFTFSTSRLRGQPHETAAEREEAERMKRAWIKKHGVRK